MVGEVPRGSTGFDGANGPRSRPPPPKPRPRALHPYFPALPSDATALLQVHYIGGFKFRRYLKQHRPTRYIDILALELR